MVDEGKPKDFWDKLAAASGVLTFLSALAIASVGWWFTDGYKKRELKLTELEVTTKMLPFLKAGGTDTKAALLAMATLGSVELAARYATLFGGTDAVEATASLAKNAPSSSGAATAKQALRTFTKTGAPNDAVAAAAALSALNSTSGSEKHPAEQVIVVASGPKLSGAGKRFNDSPYELCGEAPPGYTISDVDFRLTGDRSCGAWAECKESVRTAQRVCWQFRMQGHDERLPPGQALSEGVLRITARRQ